MTSILSSNLCICLHGDPDYLCQIRSSQFERFKSLNVCPFPKDLFLFKSCAGIGNQNARKIRPLFSSALGDSFDPDNSKDGNDSDETAGSGTGEVNNDIFRQNLERIVGSNDTAFSGTDLATLIRKRYGRSYDVQLIKKEFMGKNLLALNVMWKYMEQRSFPLSEEEYLLRLDDVANTLRCWGAVSHVRNSLEKVKERPRIGKAVSIFIDMDETGGRSNEWIYK